MATTKEYRLGEFTFPRGWFMIAEASEIDSYKPQQIRYFGHDFVLYRGRESGKPVLLDGYCCHMQNPLGAKNTTSYVVRDNGGTNIEGDNIRCPYHAWRFGPDGKCNEIPYSTDPIPENARIKAWTVVESLGAIWMWYDPEGGEPEWDAPSLPEWDDPAWVRPKYDHVGLLNQHPQEVVDNICDYAHLGPIHGSTVDRYENEFIGHKAIQRQCGGHRTLVAQDGTRSILHTITTYHGPGVLISDLTGLYDATLLIFHTPVEDGQIRIWHSLIVKSPGGHAKATVTDAVTAAQFQEASMLSFAQDFEAWSVKEACVNGMFVPQDGPFHKARIWYKQFFNPRAKKAEYLERCEGLYVPKGVTPYTEPETA
ncbi:Rieske 2Fe-2S domain-containing protein [Comamonas faecalis]